ncbi:MAG: hypothetical protein ACE10G_04390 [Gemmatimonadales bacterium]
MNSIAVTSINDLRRITEAVDQLRGRSVDDVSIRSDCRQLRIKLDDGRSLLVSVLKDKDGEPRLDVDVLHAPEKRSRAQIEVRFETGT